MQIPIEVSYRHIREYPELAGLMQEECRGLENFSDNIISCRVLMEKEQKLASPSGLHRVKTEITLPGRHRIVVKKEAKINGDYPSLAALIRATFKKTKLVLERLKERQLNKIRSSRRQKDRQTEL